MSYSILRVARVKGSSNSKGIQRHNQRENENYNNKDINHERTHLNYDLINSSRVDYQKQIEEKIEANYTGNRKVRSDAIRHVDGLITSDNEFFNNLNDDEVEQFFKDSLEFLENQYGKENMLYATVHLDERVPHMHFGFVPITEEGGLSAKQQIGNKKALTDLQDRFNQYVNSKGYELERGTSKLVTEREHDNMDQYKKNTQYHQQELQEVKAQLKELNNRLNTDMKCMRDTSKLDYEEEKHVEKGLFGKVLDEHNTGRKIISEDEFERVQQTLSSAERILGDYDEIKQSDLYKENQELSDKVSKLVTNYKGLKGKHEELQEDYSDVKNMFNIYQDFTGKIYDISRQIIPKFEEKYNSLKNVLNKKDSTKDLAQFMSVVQDRVHEKDEKQEKAHRSSQIKRRDDLEL